MVKLKWIIEEVFGKKYVIQTTDEEYLALLSKNTIPKEKPWRITIFFDWNNRRIPITHFDIDDNEAGKLAATDKIPIGLEDRLRTYFSRDEDTEYQKMTPT
jgi:hypothetical protein